MLVTDARKLEEEKRFDEALAIYNDVLAMRADDFQSLVGAARCLRENGQLSESSVFLQRAAQRLPTDRYIWGELAKNATISGNYRAAFCYFDHIVRNNGSEAWMYKGRAKSARHLRLFARAEADALIAISMMPSYLDAYKELVQIRRMQRDQTALFLCLLKLIVEFQNERKYEDEAGRIAVTLGDEGDVASLISDFYRGDAKIQDMLDLVSRFFRTYSFMKGRVPGIRSLYADLRNIIHASDNDYIESREIEPLTSKSSMMAVFERLIADGHLKPTTLDQLGKGSTHDFPRVIIQFWDKPDIPSDVITLISSFSDKNPSYAHTCFDEAAAERYIDHHFGARHVQAFRTCGHPAMKSDYFRLCYLLQDGGFYFDADEGCRAPIDMWCKSDEYDLIVCYTCAHYYHVHNWFFAAKPGHWLISASLERATALIEKIGGAGADIWAVTGPGTITTCLIDGMRRGWPFTSASDDVAKIAMISEDSYRYLASWHTDLTYKGTKEGDWRK